MRVYVDITTPPVWDGTVLRAVDLDLDVVRGNTGRVWVDDEDEFADHRVRFGYPDEWSRPRWPPATGCTPRSRPATRRTTAQPRRGSPGWGACTLTVER